MPGLHDPNPDRPPQLDTGDLAVAAAEILVRDLDELYARRSLEDAPELRGHDLGAAVAAGMISYLAARLLRQIQYYERAMKLIRLEEEEEEEEEEESESNAPDYSVDPDRPF